MTDRGLLMDILIVSIVENEAVPLMEGLGGDMFIGGLCAIQS